MIRINEGDLLCIEGEKQYYYVLILDKIKLFGGQLCFVYHKTTSEPVGAVEIVKTPNGFYEIIDFIWAKREKRITKIKDNIDIKTIKEKIQFFKNTFTLIGKAELWIIYDKNGNEVKKVNKLNDEEIKYPIYHRIDDRIMMKLVDEFYLPENDERI